MRLNCWSISTLLRQNVCYAIKGRSSVLTGILANKFKFEIGPVSGTHLGTLETGEVGIAPFYQFDSLISSKVKADLEQIKKDIIAGKINTNP